jgi:putative transposase
MAYNPEIHNRRSIRLPGYDYAGEGMYFITICTHNRQFLFGTVVNRKMVLNDAGMIANQCWKNIPAHFPNAVLHEHIIMPNHVHGIIELKNDRNIYVTTPAIPVGNDGVMGRIMNVGAVGAVVVGAENFLPLQPGHQFQKMIPRSIASIVKGYKIGVTKWYRSNMPSFANPQTKVWQRNYYEHIIRNEQSYSTISNYIMTNPENWAEDRFYTNALYDIK